MAKDDNIDLQNPEFQSLWKLINYTDNSVFLTGKAGTGKSTFLRYICEHTKKSHVVLAPTGIAAVNVGGQTMHSFFGLPFKPLTPDDPEFSTRNFRKRIRLTKSKIKLLKKLELIIIDEISMVRADIIDFVDRLLRIYCGNMRQPFAGKQLLLVGDIFQLEPVVTTDARKILTQYYPNSFFFSAHVFRHMSIVSIELRKVYRQEDGEFISLLDRIRMGGATQHDVDLLNSRLKPLEELDRVTEGDFSMTLAARREAVDAINDRCLDSIQRPLVTYIGKISGDFPENSLPTPVELQLKEGAQVVFIKNDREQRWVNGTIGRVHRATKSKLEIELESGEVHEVDPEVWENIKYLLDEKTGKIKEKVEGTFTQFPVRLAWALTIHKSQGLTFNKVDIDLGRGAFSGGQTYVALSRCRSLEGLSLRSTVNQRDVFINPAIIEFSHQFNDDERINKALSLAEADDAYRRAAEAIDDGRIVEAFDAFVNGLRHRSEIDNPAAMRLARRKLSALASKDAEIDELNNRLAEYEQRFEALAQEYVSMGYDCLEDGYDYQPAYANFEKALSLVPDNIHALIGKGRALEAMSDTSAAIDAFHQAVEADHAAIDPLLRLARIYLAEDELHEALDNALKAFDLNSDDWKTLELLADIYDKLGEDSLASRYRTLSKKLRNGRRKK